MDKFFELVQIYFEKYNKNATVALRNGNGFVFVSPSEKEINSYSLDSKLSETKGLIKLIFKAKKGINAIIVSSLRYTKVVADSGKKIPPILDDLAQIVGPSVKVSKKGGKFDILLKLFFRNACLIKGIGSLAVGRTLDEVNTSAEVIEKASKSFIEAVALGSIRPIEKAEAALMHIVYKLKYSKLDQTKKLEEIRND